MKTTETLLIEFIHDFKLELPGIGICFEATIMFTTASFHKKFTCEVHIITMEHKKLSVVYLLHGQLEANGIPDIFPFDAHNFSYEKNKNLTINDYDLLRGKYSLAIFPLNTKCDSNVELQMNEIRMGNKGDDHID